MTLIRLETRSPTTDGSTRLVAATSHAVAESVTSEVTLAEQNLRNQLSCQDRIYNVCRRQLPLEISIGFSLLKPGGGAFAKIDRYVNRQLELAETSLQIIQPRKWDSRKSVGKLIVPET